MNLVFVASSWLWLLLLVPLFWFLPHRAVNRWHAAIRSAVAVLLVLALARPALLTVQEDTYQVLVWDRSESVGPSTAAGVERLAERLADTSRVRVVTLDGDRGTAGKVGGLEPVSLRGSSAGRALKAGARLIPEGAVGALTFVSDGMTTDRHWGDAVRQLVERRIPVHTIAVPPPGNEVYPAAIHARPPVRVGQMTRVTVDVVGTADQAVVSLVAGEELLARSTPFTCAGRTTVELEFEPSRAGLLDVVASVQVTQGTDPDPDNNDFPSTLAVQEPIRALYLSERLTNSRDRMSDLLGPGIELSEPSRAGVSQLAKDADGLSAYDLVVIDDRPAESIPLPVQEAIVNAVQNDGVGLFYAGGKGVFGTGGYFDTPIASILPVEILQKEEKRDPSTTLVVIIDTSGSMSGERVQLAKECARLAIRRLLPHDKVGIVEFYGTKQWAAPIQSAANAIDIQRAINRMDAGGGTVILPAIEEAFYAMQNVQTRYKHVLVLTDGGVESGDFESLMRQMAAKGINVSTVLVGSDAHSEFLVNIANWGKGHFYSASSRFNIPEVLLKQPSTSKIPPYRPGSHLVSMGGPSGWWGEIPRPAEPKLTGYVETRLRPGAQVAIETETERHPVLASWRYGLGRVSAFTTEPVGEGTAPWREWDGYGAWLMRVLSRTSREHPQPFACTIERSPTGARIVARRLTGQSDRPRAERVMADGVAEPLVFRQRSPDVFTATVLEDPGATLHVRAGAEGWTGRMAQLVSPAWRAVAPEHNVDPARAVDLALLASTTGGRSVAPETMSGLNPATGGTGTATDLHRLWPWCLILALLAYLGDLLFRRWPGTSALGGRNAIVPLLVIGFLTGAAPDLGAEVSPALEAHLQRTLKEDPFQVDDGLLYTAALLEDESLDPLLERLDALIGDHEQDFEAIWLAASLHWRYGMLDDALGLFQKAAEIRNEPLPLFRVAQLLDAQGKTAEAAEQYLKTLEAKPDEALSGRVQLRLALLKSTETGLETLEEDLATYARKQDQDFQNRAGVVLALTGTPKEALALYKPAEEGNQVFKQLIRVAEWSMAAKDMGKAQESAWGALRSAKLKRDRRYALTVLAEAYRSNGKLDQLIARFAATPGLSDEARMTWIDLLREQGDADKALALFQEARAGGDGGFTAEMRREMLGICREAGRDDLLVGNFREMIAQEPRRLEWRSGLCRFYLERGERDKGLEVWTNYRDEAQRGDWLAAAGAAMELGLDELAQSFAEELVRTGQGNEPLAALQFLFDLHKTRGREDAMRAVLTRMDALAAPDASERARLAESWEQLGRQDKAVEVLEKLRGARGPGNFSSDLETRLAWLYSETGAEEKAYDAWKQVWLRIDSPGRRRYIEDRFMATASRLGRIADIAIELEEKLAEGKADQRDSALLVRLYTKVGDPVSASEIIHDFMKQSGGAEIKMLEEQARVYVMCNDYYHYEKTLRKLMELDPEGSPEYLTQLAMSALERGRNDEARAILTEMRGLEENPASAEFEAGVLKIAGMHEEATAAYWRGIAQHPDRIDAYLLLGRSLQTLGKGPQAAGLFQYLVETADKDDLFTIAIDGMLNMNNPRQGSRLTPETLRWARRAILERLAARDDKVYLFQLLSDVSEDLRDQKMMIRTLAETLPIAGERRTAQLRELMELARVGTRDKQDMLRFGRRLIGMGEIIPPQVYLDLGSIFLESGDIRNAVKTFDHADGGLDQAGYQRKVAGTFEQKRYVESALRSYEKLLITAPDDPAVLVKVGELKEQMGRDAEAVIAYRRALDVLVGGQPLFSFKEDKSAASGSRIYYFSRNVDRFDKYYLRVVTGFLAASDPGGNHALELINDSLEALGADLERARKESAAAENTEPLTLANVPRIARRSRLIRRLALADGHLDKARAMESTLLEAFPEDQTLLPGICRAWDSWGYGQRARDLVGTVPANPGRKEARQALGEGGDGGARQVFQMILNGDRAGARARLRDPEQVLGERGTSAEFSLLFAIARCAEDPAAVERLARFAISRTPKSQRLVQSYQMLAKALPSLDQGQRDRLVTYVESVIGDQDTTGTSGIYYYYYPRLKQLTGKDLKLPMDVVRPQIEQMLARGGHYNRYIASMFSFLNEEDYRILLRDTYRKAKASDRLAIVFSLIRQYPGKMDAGTEGLFIELAAEAAEDAMDDPLKIYQANTRSNPYGDTGTDANAGFEARLLENFAEGEPQEETMGYLTEQVRAWHRAGDMEHGMEAIAKLLALATQDEKTFTRILSLQRELPASWLEGVLSVFDRMEQENGLKTDLEKKRLLLVRQSKNPGRLLRALREAIRKFPQEAAFRQDLRKELESEGRHYEAIKVLEDLLALEPDNQQHRVDLRAAWNRLSHPIKARAVEINFTKLKAEAGERVATKAPSTSAARPVAPRPATPAAAPGRTAGGDQEKPLAPPSTQLIKQHHEAGELGAARLELRRLWRRFAALDQASRSRFYRTPGAAHSRYYEWPGEKPPAVKKPPTSPSPKTGLGGLRAFLATDPLARPITTTYYRPTAAAGPSMFSEIGSEEFAAGELGVWLRTFDPRDYQAPIFEEILRGVIERRIAEEGLEPFVQDAMAKSSKGELSALDQHALLATLELHPEAGGEAADLFLDTLRETLDPADLWKAMRMARCFLKRGNEDAALSLYQWCGANASHSRYISYNAVNVTANTLVEELRNNLDGASRIRALDAVLPLVSPDSRMSSSEGGFFQFVLSTWNRELAPHEVYQRCPEICREVIRVDNPTQNNYPQSLELATLFLAAGGEPDEALRGFERLMFRPARTSRSTTNRGDHRDYLLQQCLPEDMSAWTNADRWLAGIARLLQQWEADRKLPTADAVKILSLVAVRQHQNKFEDDAQATLATIGTLSLTNPDAAVWFIDAAGITGNQALAREVATTLLRERRLPVNRVAPLMEAVAAQLGAPAALQLAEETVDYTWERGFLETMVKISTNAKDEDATQIWKNRRQEALKPDAPRPAPPAASADANEAFRQLCEASEAGQHDKTLELGEAFLKTCPHHPEIATALHLAAKAAIATSHRERAVFLLRKIVGDHPAFDAIDEVRFGLAESLSATRALEECIALCRENLEVSPNSSGADYFRFLIPQSQFRLWRFQEAEEGLQAYLAQYPESQYADHAERYLDKINPSWRVDEDGLAEYSGKYEEDYRFKAAVAALPGHIEQGRDMIRERLGVDIDFTGTVNFIFRDAGAGGQGGLMAQTFTVCRDYKPVTVMRFYAEHVVNDPESFRMTVIHEMKHAGFKVLMGRAYDDVPDWISEGLAQWAADQGKSRMTSALNSEAFAGQDPVSLLNGVANPAHDLGDYLEDILAFEWLEKHQPGSVKAFGEGLVQGVPWSELLAATSGLDAEEALRRMDDYCRDRVAAELGEAGQEALALRDTQIAKGNQGSQILKAWLREEGTRRFAEWVDQHPGHVLQPAMRFYTGRGLILAGKFAEGREWLRNLIDSQEGGSLIDDALFYEGYAFQQEKRMGDAERSFRILLRDYSWSSNAPKVRGAFQPAGPEREPSPDATGSNL